MFGVGLTPPEYNHKVHGPYNPGTYYGKPDPIAEVKIGDIGKWLSRRNFTPQAIAAAISRGHWRWAQKYLLARKTSVAPLAQAIVALSTFYYFLQYRSHTNHRHAKYHW